MSYLVLARKYRPKTFAEVVGQEVTTGVLRGAIEEDRVGHAYLFHGPRGTGKTTTARILAKALNCERGPAPDPCGECERCLATDEGTEVDVVEIDAASHTGVDHVRELRDQAAYAPMRARNKIYVIDEVHMLSKGAFNALLKTLEEPPPNVVFLFATTERHKVPDTILSRCQVLTLSPIREATIAARLAEVLEREGVEPGEGVVEELARRARGGMRDALSLTDQLLALVGDRPQVDDLERLGGDAGVRELEALFDRVEEGDRAGALLALPAAEGGEAQLVDGMLDFLRSVLVASLCGPETPQLQGGEAERLRLAERGKRLGVDRVRHWLEELLYARGRLRNLPGNERVVVELAVLEVCRPGAGMPLGELEARLAALEGRVGDGATLVPETPTQPAPPATGSAPPMAGRAPEPESAPAPPPADPSPGAAPTTPAVPRSLGETWRLFLEELAGSHGGLADVLSRRGRLEDLGERRAVVVVEGAKDSELRIVRDRRNQAACGRALSAVAGRELSVTLDDGSAVPPGDQDGFTREVADLFGGVVEDRG